MPDTIKNKPIQRGRIWSRFRKFDTPKVMVVGGRMQGGSTYLRMNFLLLDEILNPSLGLEVLNDSIRRESERLGKMPKIHRDFLSSSFRRRTKRFIALRAALSSSFGLTSSNRSNN